jgi:hypothetical protein
MAKIKIDPADRVFSWYVRLRDGKCQRCGSRVEVNDKGLPVSHNASHYFSRGRESTRYDSENVICLCFPCHQRWGGDEREEYKKFMIQWLGEDGFKRLCVRAETFQKKDRKLAYLVVKKLLEEVQKAA